MSAPDLDMGEKLLADIEADLAECKRLNLAGFWDNIPSPQSAATMYRREAWPGELAARVTRLFNNLPALLATARRVAEMEGALIAARDEMRVFSGSTDKRTNASKVLSQIDRALAATKEGA